MQSKITITVLFLFCFISLFSQKKIDIKLKSKTWDASKKNIQRFIVSINQGSDTCIYVKGSLICAFQILKVKLQNSSENLLSPSLAIFLGTNTQNQIVIIVDKNRNHLYNDDSVYSIDFKSYKNQVEFAQNIPVIKIDSIEYFTDNNVRLFYNATIKVAPSDQAGRNFSSKEEFDNSKKVNIDFYVLNYYSGIIEQNNSKYEIAIVPHPIIYPLITIPESKYDYRMTYLNTYLMIGERKDSLLTFNLVANYLTSNKKHEYIKIGNSLYYLESVSLSDSLIRLVEVDRKPIVQNRLKVDNNEGFKLVNTRTSKVEKIIIPAYKKYLLLHFTGSWCMPCQTSLPELKEFTKKNKDIIYIVSIQKENSIKEAKEYIQSKEINWECYYEKLFCLEEECYERKLTVSAYPSFLLFDRTGRLILRAEGDNGLIEVKKTLLKLRIVKQ